MSVYNVQYKQLAKEAIDVIYKTSGFPPKLKGRLEDMISQVLPPHIYEFTTLLVPKTFQMLRPDANHKDLMLACKLGWCYEMYQSYDYVVDDSFEGLISPETRRDFQMIKGVINLLLRQHFFHLGDIYYQLVNLFLEACKAHKVEALRTVRQLKQGIIPLESFDVSTYCTVAYLKGAPVHFYLPVALAMTLSGEWRRENRNKFESVKKLCVRLGNMFQCMEDYCDSFGGAEDKWMMTRDRDIRKGQFSWVFLTVKEHFSAEEDWETLKENYGKDNDLNVAIVKQLYEKVNVPRLYTRFKALEYSGIQDEAAILLWNDEKIEKVVKWCTGFMLTVFANTAEETNSKLFSVDISPEMVEFSKKHFSDPRICYGIGSVPDDFPFSEKFDRVFAVHVLPLIPDIQPILKGIKDVLKPGGQFGFTSTTIDHAVFRTHIYLMESPLWKPYMEGLNESLPEWSKVPQGRNAAEFFRNLFVNGTGFKEVSFLYSRPVVKTTMDKYLDFAMSLNPFLGTVPNHLKGRLKEEYRQCVSKDLKIPLDSEAL